MLTAIPGSDHGIPEVTVAETARVHADASAQLVDVREDNEWAEGHIAGAVHIPLATLVQRAGELQQDRPVVTICRVGQRSLHAADALLSLGFAEVASMQGGMVAWVRAGHPVE